MSTKLVNIYNMAKKNCSVLSKISFSNTKTAHSFVLCTVYDIFACLVVIWATFGQLIGWKLHWNWISWFVYPSWFWRYSAIFEYCCFTAICSSHNSTLTGKKQDEIASEDTEKNAASSSYYIKKRDVISQFFITDFPLIFALWCVIIDL